MAPQSSFATYRQAIRTAHPPVIPYLGVSMQDMVFIGNVVCVVGVIPTRV